jgi:transcriptional regulator with XRE-family HTH domain
MVDAMSNEPHNTPDRPVIPEWTLADRLHKARKHAGYDQGELADAIGIARASLSAYENGHRTPRRPVLLSWAMATGVSLEWLEKGTPVIHVRWRRWDDDDRIMLDLRQLTFAI